MTTDTKDFLLRQYDSLRKEIENFIRELSILATYAALASGAIWAFIITSQASINTRALNMFVALIPNILVFLMALRAFLTRRTIFEASDHCAKIEKAFDVDTTLGWDSCHQERRNEKQKQKLWVRPLGTLWARPLDMWLYIYWSTIVASNILAFVMWMFIHRR
jgi:hypothetical protein